MKLKADKMIEKARAGLVLDEPFFASLALRLTLKEDPRCPTGWTDGKSLGYNPKWVEGLTLPQVKGFLAHEVEHIAFLHHTRRGERDHKKWNVAGDHVINLMLDDNKFDLPPNGLMDRQYRDMSTDAVFAKLPDQPEGGGGKGGEGGSGEGGSGEGGSGEGEGQDGSGDPGECGEVRDAPGKDGQAATPSEMAQAEQETKIAVTQAAQAAKVQGKLPAGIERIVKDLLAAKVDWREILRRFVMSHAKNDYSWTPPNRRYVHQGLYLPSLRSDELGPVVILDDTSGSMDQEAHQRCASEISGVLEAYDTSVYVVYVDTRVAGYEVFKREDLPLVINSKGGGGTDFRPGFEWIREQGIDPSCVIYMTDLECSSYPSEPGYPVLWAHISGGYGREREYKVPFGEVVKVD